jgi:hypothetical protein
MESIEAGNAGQAPVETSAPALVAFVRAIGLKKGDVQRLTLTAPDGSTLAENAANPLDADKAQAMLFVGKRRSLPGWAPGTYRATYEVDRGGITALTETFTANISP